MNFEAARTQMILQQVRAWEVLDDRVLDVLARVPRELYVPEAYRELAFADTEIPLGHGQTMMTPKVEGRVLQALDLGPVDSVLEIGTGSGFLTACLAELAGRVLSLEIFDDLAARAREELAARRVTNVEVLTQDAFAFSTSEQFDAIVVTGSLPQWHQEFFELLRPGGRLAIVIGRPPVMESQVITRRGRSDWAREELFETVLGPLINAQQVEPFSL